jgi:uncharacterized protein YndB with AHSA1/START domain
MTVETSHALNMTRTIAASPERVFEAWTSKGQMEQWACPDPSAKVECEIDLRVGGAYSISMGLEDGTHVAAGTYREVDPPNRLVYTWDWVEGDHHMGVDTIVTVDFVAVDGGTEVRLVHEGFPVEELKVAHEQGWGPCMDAFGRLFA